MILPRFVPFLLSGLPLKIEPTDPRAETLLDALPDEFWDGLNRAESDAAREAAWVFGRAWIRDNWRQVLPTLGEAPESPQGVSPLPTPCPTPSDAAPGSLEAPPGLAVSPGDGREDLPDLPPDCPDEQGDFQRDFDRFVRAAGELAGLVLEDGEPIGDKTPTRAIGDNLLGQLRKIEAKAREVQAAIQAMAEWADRGEDPLRDGWVDGRGRP